MARGYLSAGVNQMTSREFVNEEVSRMARGYASEGMSQTVRGLTSQKMGRVLR